MTVQPLELPPIPEIDCTQARFAKLLLDHEVADFNALKIGDTEAYGLYVVTQELLEGRARRLRMTADFLLEYLGECDTCVAAADECPMKDNFDFIVGKLVTINEDI